MSRDLNASNFSWEIPNLEYLIVTVLKISRNNYHYEIKLILHEMKIIKIEYFLK